MALKSANPLTDVATAAPGKKEKAIISPFEPLGDYIIVQRWEGEDKGTIIIPDTAKKRTQHGLVIAAGPGRWREGGMVATRLKPGEHVYWNAYAGTEIEYEKKKYLVMREEEIVAVLKA